MKALFLLVLVCLFADCAPRHTPEEQEGIFFDLSDFIDAYCATTDSLVDVRKSITVDGEKEEQELADYPMHRDIMSFESLDLNKAALWDRYSVDTAAMSGVGNFQITYSALDENLSVQSLIVAFAAGKASSIQVMKEQNTFLADVSTYIEWLPAQGYFIEKNEGQLFSDPTLHEIRVDLR